SGAPGRVRQSAAAAVYKQWIPNTNFETASNWEKGRVPCASDVVRFEKNKVSYLPLNGEFVLASGAGFAAFDGSWDPGCDSGILCPDQSPRQPLINHANSAQTLLQSGRIFSVDEERVPCRYDDVIFQPETSFRVNVDSSQRVIHLRSISLMGQELSSPEAWAGYLRGPSAPLQFHGNGTLRVTGTGCPDKSGCACGNAPVSLPIDGHRICAALLGVSGRQCPAPACQSPLQPLGHCCGVCGEWGAWPYSSSPLCWLPQFPSPGSRSLKPLGEFHISTNCSGMGSAGVPQSPPSPQSQGSVAESQPCSPKTRYMQSVLEGHMGESFPGKASLQNMVETKSLSSNPVNKKTSEGARGFLGQHCSGRAVELPLLSPARPVAQIYWRVLSAFRGSRSCAAVAAVCPGSVTVSCLSVFGLQEPPLTWISLLILTCRSTGTGWSKAC
uniref:Protein amnionless n=1 Tax=Buteo japonicus TaxID=224669 RepID=A0A8C0BDA6_9AVES